MSGMLQKDERAPAIDLEDLDGRRRRPLDRPAKQLLRGGSAGPVLLVFIKDECPTCRYTLPFLERVHRGLEGSGTRIWAISQDDRERSSAFAASTGVTFPLLLDGPGYAVSRAYGIEIVPSLFVVDHNGVIERSIAGFRRSAIEEIASDLAAAVRIPAPRVFREGEQILEVKPG